MIIPVQFFRSISSSFSSPQLERKMMRSVDEEEDKPDSAVPHPLLAGLKLLKQPKAAGHHWGT